MTAVESSVQASTGEVVQAVLAQLGPGPKVRSIGKNNESTDLDHVRALVASGGGWPPITVTGIEGRILDGHHRAAAARELGWTTIPAVVVDVDHKSIEAFILAFTANTKHGRNYSLSERKSAAYRLIKDTDWSDNRIAGECGLSDKTVTELRPKVARATSEFPKLRGADGRARPANNADAAERRQHAAREVQAKPTASDREIAQRTGLSARTVADVRRRNAAGEDPAPPRLRAVPDPEPAAEPPKVTAGSILRSVAVPWVRDERCQVSNAARAFARVMDRFTGDALKGVEQTVLDGCPPGDVAHMAGVHAREAAAMWTRIATSLSQPRPMKGA